MAVKKMIRKTITKKDTPESIVEKPAEAEETSEITTSEKTSNVKAKKVCQFCKSKTVPIYTDTSTLRRFTSDRAKIVPRSKSGLCSKHQREVTRQIKYARHLSLLPFTPKV